jgi:CRP-like cAMP-binding protein
MTDAYDMIREAIHRVSNITDDDWNLFKPGLRHKKIQKGKYFVEEGKTYKEIAFVISGLFRAYYVIDGEEINCDFYFEGQWPKAYHSFLTQTPSRMWIQALEDAEVFLIGYDHLQNLFTKNKNWERFGRIATENAFVASQARNEMLLLDKPQMRYLNLYQSHPRIFERVPLYHIASYLGIKQPSLSRIRKRLQKIQPDTRL